MDEEDGKTRGVAASPSWLANRMLRLHCRQKRSMNKAALAIMAKIRLLYDRGDGSQGRFVSFPVLGLPLSSRDLTFDPEGGGVRPAEALNAEAEFALLVNRIPSGHAVWEHDGRLLWNVYRDVLQAQWADRNLTASEESELTEAYALLYETEESSAETVPFPERTESANLQAYRHWERIYQDVSDRLTESSITARFTEDPEDKERAKAEVQRLERERKQAERDWVDRGFRHEVEEAFADIDRIKGNSPQLLRDSWEDQLERAKATNAVADYDFYQTRFFPDDFFRDVEGTWTEVQLTSAEIEKLCAWASIEMPELSRTDLGTEADVEIERLSVELAHIEVVRGWADPLALHSRAWRWWDDQPALSDGKTPSAGQLPAYVVSFIVARNLDIQLDPSSIQNERAVHRLKNGQALTLGPLLLGQVANVGNGGPKLGQALLDTRQRRLLQGRIAAPSSVSDRSESREKTSPLPSHMNKPAHTVKLAGALDTIRLDLNAAVPGVLPPQGTKLRLDHLQLASQAAPFEKRLNVEALSSGGPFQGTWKTTFGELRLVQEGQQVRGDYNDVGVIGGTYTPRTRTLEGTFTNKDRGGRLRFVLKGGRFEGTWAWDESEPSKPWTGMRTGVKRPTLRTASPPSSEPKPSPEPAPTRDAAVEDTMQLVAFVCQKIPKAPDPDPDLDWD